MLILPLLLLVGCPRGKTCGETPDDPVYDLYHFGMLERWDGSHYEREIGYPNIPQFVHRSVYAVCPEDSSRVGHFALALRCPPYRPLLKWLSQEVGAFAGGFCHDVTPGDNEFGSAEEILDFYSSLLSHPGDGLDSLEHCHQSGLLIADCWSGVHTCTFRRIEWDEDHGCRGTYRESWQTVDETSGRPLGIDDFIIPGMKDSLAVLMSKRLVSDNGENYFTLYGTGDYRGVLDRASGLAWIQEGLVIYFHPYSLGCGADGGFKAVIPGQELIGIVNPIPFFGPPTLPGKHSSLN